MVWSSDPLHTWHLSQSGMENDEEDTGLDGRSSVVMLREKYPQLWTNEAERHSGH